MKNFMLLVAANACLCGWGEIPKQVDLLVIGGSVNAVQSAIDAKRNGENVFLVTSYPYLGEDMASTLELGFGQDERGGRAAERSETAEGREESLVRKMWKASSDIAPFDYWPDHPTQGKRWVYHNDPYDRLSEPGRPPSPADAVLYTDDVSYKCILRKPSNITKVEVIVLETCTKAVDGVEAMEERSEERRGLLASTEGVSCEITAGPLRGQTLELQRQGRLYEVHGDYYRGNADAISFTADVPNAAELSKMTVRVRKAPAVKHQLISRIRFHLANAEDNTGVPSPLKVKRTLDRAMLDAGVGFLTMSPVRRVQEAGSREQGGWRVEIVNRSGRQVIKAKRVLDFRKSLPPAGEVEFSRVIVADGEPPANDRMKVVRLEGEYPISHTSATGHVYRCTFKLPMAKCDYPSLAAAEWEAREITWTAGMMDDADQMTWEPSFAKATEGKEDWGEYDVVVVGGGTAGSPAAIAAARAGAKTLLVEYCNVLGGTGTDGMILGYYDGNHCGFTEEFKQANVATKAKFSLYPRAETWRRMCREAGVTVFLGAMGSGALVKDGKVEGVEIATPYGMGTVRARCVIDATGNSDVAASAGALTTFLSADEFALQSAGQAPHRIGRNGINSDFGFVNDSDVLDLWLFGLRARAGAPDAWDIAKMPDSRERRRIVPDYMVCAEDVGARRPFPDTVVQACSRQDSHGYLTDDFRFVSAPSAIQRPTRGRVKEMRWMFDVNVPMRSLLPKGLTSIAVVGLGAGCARDVLPMVRMQADLMNMGYAVGTAAAMAAPIGGDFRRIDYAGLRAKLVEKGILRKETLDWNSDTDVSSPELVADSVATMTDSFRGSDVVFRKENRELALPLLRDAYRKASTSEARQIYALMLGLMGDDTGVKTLVGIVDGSLPLLNVRRPGGFGGVAQPMDGYLVALGRTRSPLAVAPLAKRLEMVSASASVNDIRGITLALEALGSPKVAERLAKFLEEGWFGGHSVKDISQLKPQGGYGLDDEMDGCIREMAFARALLASGDFQGKGREVYERYARDPRGVLSAHAKAVLERARREEEAGSREQEGGDVQLRGKIGALLESSLNHRVYSAHARGPVIEECENSFRTHWDDSVDENGKRRTGWQNEYWGKTMLCYAGAIRYTHDRALAEWCVAKAHYLIDTYQHEDGYLSTYGEQDFLRKDPGNPDPNAHWCFNIWGQKYTMWALIELYRTTGDMKCLDAAEKMMDQLIAQMKRLGTTIDRTGSWAGLSSMTILRPLLELNRERPKPEYRALADHIVKVTDCDGETKPIMNLIHDTFTDRPIVSWFDRPGFLAKAYEMQNFFEGVADYHRVTGDRRSLDAVVRFWEHLMREELNPMRSVGYFDHFLGSRSRVNGMSELCDITHFIRLGRELWKLTGRTQYLDAIEEAFYNAFLAGVSPEGDWGAHIVRSHGSRHLSAPPQTGMQLHQCCPDNMLRTFYDWAETVADVSADEAYEINFYSDADVSLPGAMFKVRGGYPISESFRISATVGKQSRLRLRVPYWANEITVNGEKMPPTEGRVELALAAGNSQLEVRLAMPVRMVKSEAPAVEDVVAVDRKVKLNTEFFMKWNAPEMKNPVRTTRAVQFMRGPIVLAKGRIAGTSREETLDFTSIDGQDGWKATLKPAKRTAVNAAAWGVWQLTLDDGQRQKQIPVADFWSVSNVDDPENWFSLWF